MLKIVASASIKPECKAQFIETARPLIEASRAEEGNISYALHESITDPNTMAFIEVWKDQDAIDLHNKTEHFTTICPKFADFFASPMSGTIYREV
jgi:quinol monooxygenase YgiN